jgi:hypothetical protein
LSELSGYGDSESVHNLADNLLLEALKELGFGQIADTWDGVKEDVGFWYA